MDLLSILLNAPLLIGLLFILGLGYLYYRWVCSYMMVCLDIGYLS